MSININEEAINKAVELCKNELLNMNKYNFYVTIKINCNKEVQRFSIPIRVYATSSNEAAKLLRTTTTFSIEEPIMLIADY